MAKEIGRVLWPGLRSMGDYLEGPDVIVSWAFGHLVGLADASAYKATYQRWHLEDLPILPQTFQYQPLDRGRTQLAVLHRLMQRPDVIRVVNACDAGREGELIFRLIYQLSTGQQPVERLWLSETTPSAIKQAWQGLRDGKLYDALGSAAHARMEADWLVGINATRAFTVRHRDKLTVGRVQTPTLAMVVERERAIREFRSEPFFQVIADFAAPTGNYRGRWVLLGKEGSVQTDRLENKDEADKIAAHAPCRATIRTVRHTVQKPLPPLFPNLSDVQREANRQFGLPAAKTLSHLQTLYEAGYLTYPRTDSRHITRAIRETLPARLSALASVSAYRGWATQALQHLKVFDGYRTRYVNDQAVSDHHALIPTTRPAGALSGPLLNVYDLVVRRFLAAFFVPAQVAEVEILTQDAQTALYRSVGKTVIEAGWFEILKPQRANTPKKKNQHDEETDEEEEEGAIPPLEEGMEVQLVTSTVRSSQTKPPARFTEAALLGLMETAGKRIDDEGLRAAMKTAGLGTPATRAAIIEKLIAVGYLERKKKLLIPTPKGEALIGLVPQTLAQVEMTAHWEEMLAAIERGEQSSEGFDQEIRAYARDIVQYVRAQSFSAQSRPAFTAQDSGSLGACPLCGAPVREFPKSFSCSAFKASGCRFAIWKRVAGKAITETQAKALLTKGRTRVLKGFQAKSGKVFSAALELTPEGTVRFVFGDAKKSS